MTFRDDREAARHRIDALEGQLDEKDEEIARLREELAAREAPAAPPRAKEEHQKKADPPVVAGVPPGDVWAFDTSGRNEWKAGALWLVGIAAAAGYLWVHEHAGAAVLFPVLLFSAPGLFLLVRSGVVADRGARTITVWYRLLVRHAWVVPIDEGSVIEMDTRLVSPENGDSYWSGHVFVGKRKLFSKKEREAEQLAKKLAAFLGIPYLRRRPDMKAIERQARLPLMLTTAMVAIGAAAYYLIEWLGRG
jgi:hypothetical protein